MKNFQTKQCAFILLSSLWFLDLDNGRSRVLAQLAQQSLSESLPIKTRSRQWIGGVEILI